MNLNNIIKFIYLGIAAWVYSIVVQTPFAYFAWHMPFDQYVVWAFSGLLITLIFFGALIRIYLNWCNEFYEQCVKDFKKEK